MDKRYYYRILGLREEVSVSEVKKAYEKQMKRLAQPDYADDPEYVAHKKDQLRHAYRVLTGGAEPETRTQKEAYFERLKDALDGGEDTMAREKRRFEKHEASCSKKTYFSPDKAKRSESGANGKKTKIALVVILGFSLFSSVITACINMADDLIDTVSDSLTQEIREETYPVTPANQAVSAETAERIDQILANCHMYDYYGWLDLSAKDEFADKVEWNITEGNQDDIWGYMTDIAAYMGLYSNSEVVSYVTGNPDFYWESDDLGNAQMLITIMDPPAYEEVAGGVNLYTGEVILDYSSYLSFLADVAADQTEYVIG